MGDEYLVIRYITRKLVPLIQLYGLYVIMHGESGPGGGFQGGVILASSLVLYVLAFGLGEGQAIFPRSRVDALVVSGVLLYASIGLLTMLAGGNYLEYRAIPGGTPQSMSQLGILGIEIGVGITVAGVMVTLFFEMADKGK